MLRTIDRILNLENETNLVRERRRNTARHSQTEPRYKFRNSRFIREHKRANQALIDKLFMVLLRFVSLASATQVRTAGQLPQMSCSL